MLASKTQEALSDFLVTLKQWTITEAFNPNWSPYFTIDFNGISNHPKNMEKSHFLEFKHICPSLLEMNNIQN